MSCEKTLTIAESAPEGCFAVAGTHEITVGASTAVNGFWNVYDPTPPYRGPTYAFTASKDSAFHFGTFNGVGKNFAQAVYTKLTAVGYDTISGILTVAAQDWDVNFHQSAPYDYVAAEFLIMTGASAGFRDSFDDNTATTVTIGPGYSIVPGDVVAIVIWYEFDSYPNSRIGDPLYYEYIRQIPFSGDWEFAVASQSLTLDPDFQLTVVIGCRFVESTYNVESRRCTLYGVQELSPTRTGLPRVYRTVTGSGTADWPADPNIRTLLDDDHYIGPDDGGDGSLFLDSNIKMDENGTIFNTPWILSDPSNFWAKAFPVEVTPTTADISFVGSPYGIPATNNMMLTLSDEFTDAQAWNEGVPLVTTISYSVQTLQNSFDDVSNPFVVDRGYADLMCYGLTIGSHYTVSMQITTNVFPYPVINTITSGFTATAKTHSIPSFYPLNPTRGMVDEILQVPTISSP